MWWTPLLLVGLAAVLHLLIVPLVGAGLLRLCFGLMKVPRPRFLQLWKVYFAAVAYGLSALLLLSLVLRPEQAGSATLLQAGATCLAHVIAVALLLRTFALRPLVAEGVAVLATNLAVVGVLLVVSA